MDVKTVYTQLTNIDIEQQKQIWDERGKGYYGEYLLFCELYKSIQGNGKILMNLNVPTVNSNTTEIDLILIHETGLYVFEIKHYKGTIYGKDTDAVWTQYFRTVENSTFKNPIEQNRYHIQALQKLFPSMPIHSCIVFTNYDCDIRVTNSNYNVDICQLHHVVHCLEYRFASSPYRYSMTDIDNVFKTLSPFSQMQKPVIINGTEADFFSWIQPVIYRLEEKKAEVVHEKNNWIINSKKLKKTKITAIILNIVIGVICIIISTICCFAVIRHNNTKVAEQIAKNNSELAEFKQNFLHVDEIGNEYIDQLNSYVEISNISLLPVTDDAVSFTARITVTNDIYGIALTETSKYIVMTNSGKVMEYNVFGEHLKYQRTSNMIGKGIRSYGDLKQAQFYGISNVNDIAYIKITNVELFKLDINKTLVKDKLEIELYSQ